MNKRSPANIFKEAFMNQPVIVTEHIGSLIVDNEWFIPNGKYPIKYHSQMIDGELGVLQSILGPRRILINKPVKQPKQSTSLTRDPQY